MPTYRLDLAYDGSGFHGYARQPGVRTVQGELERALRHVVGPVETVVAGRTDAGVHATGQVVSFVSGDEIDVDRLQKSLNRQLAAEIVVHAVNPAPDGFSARFSATSRTYHYDVVNRPRPDPLRRHRAWHIAEPLDVEAMGAAAGHFEGEHDFTSFCRRAEGRSAVRLVHQASWNEVDDLLRFTIVASSFCHQMVRSLVAVGVDVGRGRLEATAVPKISAARDRAAARGVAPPHGLTLVAVGY